MDLKEDHGAWPFVTVLLRRPWSILHGRAHDVDQHGTVFRVRTSLAHGNGWTGPNFRRKDEGLTWITGWHQLHSKEVQGLKASMILLGMW